MGGEQFTESLAANLGISRDEAEAVKLGVPSDEVAGLVNALCEEFAAKVNRGLALVGTLSAGTGSRRVSLSGGRPCSPALRRAWPGHSKRKSGSPDPSSDHTCRRTKPTLDRRSRWWPAWSRGARSSRRVEALQ